MPRILILFYLGNIYYFLVNIYVISTITIVGVFGKYFSFMVILLH